MADVGGWNPGPGVDLRLEREQAEDVVDRARDRLDTPGAPRPDRRADEVHHRHARAPHGDLDVEIEIGGVHADEGHRRIGQQVLLQFAPDGENLAQLAEHLDITVDRQLVHRPVRCEALLRHARAADALVGDIPRQPRMQPLEQQRGQQVAGRLAGCHADAAGRRGGRLRQRTMPRLVAAMKSAKVRSASRLRASSVCATCAAISAWAWSKLRSLL